MAMLPSITVDDPGTASVGTVISGPYTSPDSIEETGQTYFVPEEDVELQDAIASLASGAAPAQQHAYLIAKGNNLAPIAVIRSSQVPPNSNLRVVPRLKFRAGQLYYFRGVQLSGAQEATQLTLVFTKGGPRQVTRAG